MLKHIKKYDQVREVSLLSVTISHTCVTGGDDMSHVLFAI